MSISRLTRQRLYHDEGLFNKLLPYVKWDDESQVFLHADASIWSIYEMHPLLLTSTSDVEAFQLCGIFQEMIDSLDQRISLQVNWITTFDIEDILDKSIRDYPLDGVAGWMAGRWVRMYRNASRSAKRFGRPKKIKLLVSFRFDPPWAGVSTLEKIKTSIKAVFTGPGDPGKKSGRHEEYSKFVESFRGEVDGRIARLADLGMTPSLIDGQGLIDILYPLLNRRSTKGGKFRRGRNNSLPCPEYDPYDFLSNQLSDTGAIHPEDGYLIKDGRVYHTVSMVKPPKQCLPLMTIPLQSTPMESIFSVSISRDTVEQQLRRLDTLDATLGLREFSAKGRPNQKIVQQIATIRRARQEIYANRAQLVRAGVHHVQITENLDDARRAGSEVLTMFPSLNGARGLSHMISDMGVLINALPGAYDPSTDGPGWTNMIQSSRASRLLPMWGNWKGSKNALFILPSLWNKELVHFDLYDSSVAPNVIITGVSGAGKSYLLCFLIITLGRGHYSLRPSGEKEKKPPICFIFDKGMPNQPCGFERLANLFGGIVYQATPSKAPAMNFLSRLGEMDPDKHEGDFKDIFDVCVDIVLSMATDQDAQVTRLQRNEVVETLMEAHYRYRHGERDREFLLRDVVKVLREPPRPKETEDNFRMRQELAIMMKEYYGEGTYARFFDRPGALKLNERFVVFDLKGLSRNPSLRAVFLKVAMVWADEVMNDPQELDTRKVLVFDEAHDLVGKTAAGVVEAAFRLYRKRKGIVIAASQSGEDFYVGEGGQAIVQNSSHKIFLRQDPSKFHLTAQAFHLNPQQVDIIMRLQTLKGVESQFYLYSDIGESALSLPLESSFYWVSTNNGDDNQLFANLLEEKEGDFFKALQDAVVMAPFGAEDLANRRREVDAMRSKQRQGRSLNLDDGLS